MKLLRLAKRLTRIAVSTFLLVKFRLGLYKLSRNVDVETTVTLTSHGRRIGGAWVALASLSAGKLRPGQAHLYLGSREANNVTIPKKLRGFVSVFSVPDVGPYTKWFYEGENGNSKNVLIVDDDVIFDKRWFFDLYSEMAGVEGDWVATGHEDLSRASTLFELGEKGLNSVGLSKIVPMGHFGIFLPRALLIATQSLGDSFVTIAPRQDDVWFWFGFARLNIPIVGVEIASKVFENYQAWKVNPLHTENFYSGNAIAISACQEYFS